MKRDYYITPKPSPLMKLFWNAAGADHYILERATYSDQIKYMCLGGIVAATGLMAGLAGSYAFYTIFSPKTADVLDKTRTVVTNPDYIPVDTTTLVLSIIFGLIWGAIIFNIDRFIVTSTGKGDGTEAITWDEFKGAIPRIIMGAIIAITISKPVEIRMFKSEIDLEVRKQQEVEKQKGIEQAKVNFDKKVSETKLKLGKIQSEIYAKELSISDLRNEISKEITGKNGNGANYGPRAKELDRQANILESELQSLKTTPEYLSALEDEKQFKLQYNKDLSAAELKAATLDGLLIRIEKAHELNPTISLFITLLFLAIELTPVFFKLMLIKTPYDYIEENIKELMKAEQGIYVQYNYYKDKQGLERDLITHMNVEKLIHEKLELLKLQKDLTNKAIERYKEKIIKQIDQNPDAFIKIDESSIASITNSKEATLNATEGPKDPEENDI